MTWPSHSKRVSAWVWTWQPFNKTLGSECVCHAHLLQAPCTFILNFRLTFVFFSCYTIWHQSISISKWEFYFPFHSLSLSYVHLAQQNSCCWPAVILTLLGSRNSFWTPNGFSEQFFFSHFLSFFSFSPQKIKLRRAWNYKQIRSYLSAHSLYSWTPGIHRSNCSSLVLITSCSLPATVCYLILEPGMEQAFFKKLFFIYLEA